MIDSNLTSQVQSALAAAQSVLIVLPPKPNFDQVASALGLFLSLSKAGKNASLASPTRMTVEFSSLVGVDQIKDNFQGSKDSLIVSFDYVEEAIEKVSYNIKGGKFHLTIKPKAGHPPLDSQKVEYSYAGGKVDLIITVGVNALKDLGSLYEDNQEAFKESQLINLDLNPRNLRYGQVNLIDPTAASLSEQVVSLIARLRLSVDGDIGSNLLLGIEKATANFASGKVGSTTFEAAAFCLKMGARRQAKRPIFKKHRPKAAVKKVQEPKEPPPQEEDKEKPQPDWLQPKIYKGDTRV